MRGPQSISTISDLGNNISNGESASNAHQECAGNKSCRKSERKYKCEFCSMGFERPSSLKVHRRRHTKERPFPCDECDKKFTTASNLTRHRRRLHAREDPFLEGPSDLIDKRDQRRRVHPTPQDSLVARNPQSTIESCLGISVRFGTDSIRGRDPLNLTETSFQRQPLTNDQSHYRPCHGRSTDQSQTCSRGSRHSSDDSDIEEDLCDNAGEEKGEKKKSSSI